MGLGSRQRPSRHRVCSLSLGQFLDGFGLDARRLARGAARRRRDSTQLPRLACSTRDLTRRQQRLRRRFCLRCLFGPRLPVGLPNPAVLFVRQLISLAYRAHQKLQFPLFSERLIDCSCDCSPQSLFPLEKLEVSSRTPLFWLAPLH